MGQHRRHHRLERPLFHRKLPVGCRPSEALVVAQGRNSSASLLRNPRHRHVRPQRRHCRHHPHLMDRRVARRRVMLPRPCGLRLQLQRLLIHTERPQATYQRLVLRLDVHQPTLWSCAAAWSKRPPF